MRSRVSCLRCMEAWLAIRSRQCGTGDGLQTGAGLPRYPSVLSRRRYYLLKAMQWVAPIARLYPYLYLSRLAVVPNGWRRLASALVRSAGARLEWNECAPA